MKLELSSLNLRIIFISLVFSPRNTTKESEEHAFWMFGSYPSHTAVPTFMIIDFRFRTGEGEGEGCSPHWGQWTEVTFTNPEAPSVKHTSILGAQEAKLAAGHRA